MKNPLRDADELFGKEIRIKQKLDVNIAPKIKPETKVIKQWLLK